MAIRVAAGTYFESIHEGMTEKEDLSIFWETAIAEGAYETPMEGEMMFRGGARRGTKDYPRN